VQTTFHPIGEPGEVYLFVVLWHRTSSVVKVTRLRSPV
jgi:hypothetical protein